MIASDIHGSGMYAEKLIERFKEEKPDKLLLLGDLLYHGPRNDLPGLYDPKKVIALLNGIKDDLLCFIVSPSYMAVHPVFPKAFCFIRKRLRRLVALLHFQVGKIN